MVTYVRLLYTIPSDTICSFTVPMNILELGGKVKARDLVKQQDLPEIKGVF